MVDCNWKFIPFRPEEWHGVSGAACAMRDRWYCSTHYTGHYGGADEPPPATLCADEERARRERERIAARRRRWWLFKTLPARLWRTLLGGEDHGYCPRCSGDE